jgi:hypothetical protein
MPSWLPRRPIRRRRSALLLAVALSFFALAPAPGRAGDLTAFNSAIEDFAAHNRTADGYLRTDMAELAALQIDRMKTAWADVTERFAADPPPAFKDNPRFAATFTDIRADIAAADRQMDTDVPAARKALHDIREQLSALRRASGVAVLADCVLDANKAYATFIAFDKAPPDWDKPDLANAANALSDIMKRCDALADPDTRENPEFRRLIDGTYNGLTFVPKAIETKDRDLLHRVIDELRAFDNLLTFRYG